MKYVVKFTAYCGMSSTLGCYDDLDAARRRVRRRNAFARRMDCAVTRIDRTTWEHQQPDNCSMVPDYAGVLTVERTR